MKYIIGILWILGSIIMICFTIYISDLELDKEVKKHEYQKVYLAVKTHPQLKQDVGKWMEDGKLTKREYIKFESSLIYLEEYYTKLNLVEAVLDKESNP